MNDELYRCGYVAIIGRPNVGKSTLLNHILGVKLSITSRKPQTTRHQILGVKTAEHAQFIYVDTPGIHGGGKKAINRYMNKAASSVIHDVDVVLFVVRALQWTTEDQRVLEMLESVKTPVILVVNKVDVVTEKEQLLPYLQTLGEKFAFHNVVPLSALKGSNIKALELSIEKLLPANPAVFDEDSYTDRSLRFLAAEIIREKLIRELGNELPYESTVEIEQFSEEGGLTAIHALILVEAQGQKAIVIGANTFQTLTLGTNDDCFLTLRLHQY